MISWTSASTHAAWASVSSRVASATRRACPARVVPAFKPAASRGRRWWMSTASAMSFFAPYGLVWMRAAKAEAAYSVTSGVPAAPAGIERSRARFETDADLSGWCSIAHWYAAAMRLRSACKRWACSDSA
ncbi:hypothetical protein ASE01_20675 [Nocardioides sp. Root190]|nr:hypothetical protein ASE01_20675 [Nocardioides sp. Root190]